LLGDPPSFPSQRGSLVERRAAPLHPLVLPVALIGVLAVLDGLLSMLEEEAMDRC